MTYLVCGRTVDGVCLVHGQRVSEDEFIAWRAEVREEFQASTPRLFSSVQAREHGSEDVQQVAHQTECCTQRGESNAPL